MSEKRRPGRPKASHISVRSLDKITDMQTRLSLPKSVLTFRDITKEIYKRSGVSISVGTIHRFACGIEPRRPELRAALGLPCYAPAPVCPHCGNVPLAKRCPCKRKPSTAPRRNWKKAYTWAASMVMFMSRTEQ